MEQSEVISTPKYCRIITFVIFLVIGFIPISANAVDDGDGDGIPDNQDNCIEIANPDQRDTDNDHYGNLCDGDLNNDDKTNTLDLNLYKLAHRSNLGDANYNLHADFNGDNRVNTLDLNIYKSLHRKPPGPAAITMSRAEASRFLAQATFGSTSEDIDQLISLGGYAAWIDEQFNTTPSLLLPGTYAMYQARHEYCLAHPPANGRCPASLTEVTTAGIDGQFDYESIQYRFVWWNNTVEGADQLRQRVAFALSEVFVVSDRSFELQRSQFAMADYYDTFSQHAFGNYRELLEDVSLHAVMGMYLGHILNEKADPERNIRPDENYAREVMQLFSIGLYELNLDGTPQLDNDGNPIPAYGQFEVQEFARVFTGWTFSNSNWPSGVTSHGSADNTLPMVAREEYHDTEEKRLLRGKLLPAGQTTRQDLEAALDNIFDHPNVGPFIGKLLIQRLVTSNPSPAYVSRVATAFNNNGEGVRGDMFAVVKAILLDVEARNNSSNIAGFGKLREPLIRITHLLRAFGASKTVNAYWNWIVPPGFPVYAVNYGQTSFERTIAQRLLDSPSVFNFFLPIYSPPGVLSEAELVAPEFQIVNENTSMAMTNTLNTLIFRETHPLWSSLTLDNEIGIAANLDVLLEHLDIVLMSGGMTDALRSIIRTHLDDAIFDNINLSEQEKARARIRDAISLIVNSPEYLIQK